MPKLPIVCTLSPDALRARRQELLSELLKRSVGHEPLPDGLQLRFASSSETPSRITQAIEAERHCCRFLRFTLTVDRDAVCTACFCTDGLGKRMATQGR